MLACLQLMNSNTDTSPLQQFQCSVSSQQQRLVDLWPATLNCSWAGVRFKSVTARVLIFPVSSCRLGSSSANGFAVRNLLLMTPPLNKHADIRPLMAARNGGIRDKRAEFSEVELPPASPPSDSLISACRAVLTMLTVIKRRPPPHCFLCIPPAPSALLWFTSSPPVLTLISVCVRGANTIRKTGKWLLTSIGSSTEIAFKLPGF